MDDQDDQLWYFENFDVEHICTLVDANKLNELLTTAGYDNDKKNFLVRGFTEGFDLGFVKPKNYPQKRFAPNLKLRVGSKLELWNKVMKEVQLKRYAGLYRENEIPFENFVRSPVGLVPKDKGKRLD